jgi:hypothetical protein
MFVKEHEVSGEAKDTLNIILAITSPVINVGEKTKYFILTILNDSILY